MVALPVVGSAILLFSCDKSDKTVEEVNNETLMTEESENLTVLMSENGRRSYYFKTPLLEGYTLAKDPYREFRKGIDITTYQDDSLSTVNSTLVANYAIYYEDRKLWEAKGNVEVEKTDGTKLYTQQLFWNSMTKRIYSNVDTKIVTSTGDVWIGEGFESDEELEQWTFRRMKGKMRVDMSQESESGDGKERAADSGARNVADVKSAGESEKVKPANDPKPEENRNAENDGTGRESLQRRETAVHGPDRPVSVRRRESGVDEQRRLSGPRPVQKKPASSMNNQKMREIDGAAELTVDKTE